MSSDLKPFSGLHSVCAKCSGFPIQEYCEGGTRCPTQGHLSEHLHRKCAMCGFKWLEKCADESERAASNNR